MKIIIFLIIIDFTQFIHSSIEYNLTDYDSYPVCPLTLIRHKRAYAEYTRWRADQETTPEFLVKVLDEELTTKKTKPIIAVNIQPITKGGEKIIVGGVMLPPPTSLILQPDSLRDYTRFVPPTTLPVTRIEGDMYIAPAPQSKTADKVPSMPIRGFQTVGRHSQRDDSPPAGPQFLARTPLLSARQYAPISAVSFSPRTTLTPLTPPSHNYYYHNTVLQASRTTPYPHLNLPSRTITYSEDTESVEDEDITDDIQLTRSTKTNENNVQRTTLREFTLSSSVDNYEILPTTRLIKADEERRDFNKNVNEKDKDASYNMMFYNDEDNESTGKKEDIESIDNYEDKMKPHYDSTDTETQNEKGTTESSSVVTRTTNYTQSDVMYSDIDKDTEEEVVTEKRRMKLHFKDASSSSITVHTNNSTKAKAKEKIRPICSVIKLRQLNFNSPRTLHEIVTQMRQWAEDSPIAKWMDITGGNYTTMENPIYMMMVDDPSSGQIVSAKQTVMIVAGIQGRDHHAVAAALYVLYQLIERSEAHSDLLTKYRFWIIPVFNPDGYDYSMTFPQRRSWMKNLRQSWDACKSRESCYACLSYGLRCTVQPCYGVNLDRNFEYQWIPAEELRAEHPCGALYAGTRQLSEAETKALTYFLHDQRTPLYTFIAFKEGDVLGVMYPYSHTRKKRAFDHVYRQRASRAAAAAYSISGRPYVAGQTSEFLPLYAGGIEDWVDGHLGIDNTYTIMMFRPTDAYNSKLITERVVHEAYAAMDTLLLQSVEPLGPPVVTITRVRSSTAKLSVPLLPLIVPCAIIVIINYS